MVDSEEGGSHAVEGEFPVQVQTTLGGRLGDATGKGWQGESAADADAAIEDSERTMQMLARLQARALALLSPGCAVACPGAMLALFERSTCCSIQAIGLSVGRLSHAGTAMAPY